MQKRKLLGEYLIEKGIVTKYQVQLALKEQQVTGEKLGQILLRFDMIKKSDLVSALTELGVAPHTITEADIETYIPTSVLIDTMTMPLRDTADCFYVASIHHNPEYVRNRLREFVGDYKDIQFVPIDYHTVCDHIETLKNKKTSAVIKMPQDGEDDINDHINRIISNAADSFATDIHIEHHSHSLHVRFRVDTILKTVEVLPGFLASRLFSRLKDMAGMDVSERMLPQDGSFAFKHNNRMIDIRAATIPSAYGEKITLRLLDKDRAILDVHELGITKIDDWIELSRQSNGLILVCGATGSGKTTTLYATIRSLDLHHKSVYMIEDPIEYRIPFVTQVQVNRRIDFKYAEFVRAILRHDPDVCVVGEIRDRETAENALRLADTGHLVYATLHTNDVPSSIIRLLDLDLDKTYLRFLLRGILVQKLARKLCTHCMGAGCGICDYEGYKGLTLLTEFAVLKTQHDIEAILNGNQKYWTFQQDVEHKIQAGIINVSEAMRVLGKEYV